MWYVQVQDGSMFRSTGAPVELDSTPRSWDNGVAGDRWYEFRTEAEAEAFYRESVQSDFGPGVRD